MQTENFNKNSESTSSLLAKYDIPVTHLDYEYINNCKEAKELEKIVLILRSNEEGHFPHLTKVAEQKLQELKPKSKLLQTQVSTINKNDLNIKDRETILTDLQEFVQKMNGFDSELVSCYNKNNFEISEIRKIKEVKEKNNKISSNRIKSTDYASWDKYDADTECLKMDLEEEKLKKVVKKEKIACVKPVLELSTNAEAEFEANRAKIKGNECYKNGDYEQAIQYYNSSIEIKPLAAVYTNRALANMKIKNYGDALKDCKAALKLDVKNIKAYLRMSEIYEDLHMFALAIECLDNALILDPNNIIAQNAARRMEKYRPNKKKLRFKIENATLTENYIPIAGTSRMNPPFYVVAGDKKECVFNKPQLLHYVNTDNLDANECVVNHLEHRCSKKVKIPVIDSKKSLFTLNNAVKEECLNVDENGSGDSIKVIHIQENKETCYENYYNLDINSPFAFLNAWNSASKDNSYKQKALILKRIDFNILTKVIGNKLDSKMLTDILLSLRLHFLQPEHLNRIHGILKNLTKIARFNIMKMFLTKDDIENVKTLIHFLNKYETSLSNDIKDFYI